MRTKALIIIVLLLSVIVVSGLMIHGKYVKNTEKAEKSDILYWTCGMHPQVKQDKPGNCPVCNMKLIPVQEDVLYGCGVMEEGHCPHCDQGKSDAECICGGHSYLTSEKGFTHCPVCKKPLQKMTKKDAPIQLALIKTSHKENKIRYYRNPMDPSVTSSTPMKDSMGMDYIPVYEEDVIPVPPEKDQSIISRVRLKGQQEELSGIKTASVARQYVFKKIRTVGKIAYDPALTVAQEEFMTAVDTLKKVSASPDKDVLSRAEDIVERSKTKLKLLGLTDDEILELEQNPSLDRSLILPESKMWVYADIYENELGWIKVGQDTDVSAVAYPGEEFKGKVVSINPVLDPATRSVKIRIQVDSPDLKLKPEMYVDVAIKSNYQGLKGEDRVLSVPQDAVLATGVRAIVYVKAGAQEYIGKEVKLGPLGEAEIDGINTRVYPVLAGLEEGDVVVTKGGFLIDSQSQLTGGLSVLWGGASEVQEKETSSTKDEPLKTQHKH